MNPTTPLFGDDFVPRVHPDVIVDYADAQQTRVILLHPVEARWALTNQTGLAMAQALDGTRSLLECARRIAAQFDGVDVQVVLADIRSFLARLYECNLLENAPLAEAPATPDVKRPPSLTIYVTEQCNLRCKHCSIVEGKMPETLLTADDIRRMIDEHTAAFDNPTVAFLGGEPLMRPDCIDLLAYACARTTTVNMSTNGLYVDEDIARRLAALPVNMQVSLDGADPEVHDYIRGKGTYAKAWAAIERLAAAGDPRRLTIATTLTRAVFPQVRGLIERCDRLAIGKIRFLPLDRSKAAITHWEQIAPDPADFQQTIRYLIFDAPHRPGAVTEVMGSFPGFVPKARPKGDHWCPLGQTLIVNSQGQTYNCPLGTSGTEPPIGNIFDSSLGNMLAGENNRAAREKMLERRFAVEECRSCAWRNFCQGGCSAFISHRSGSFYLNDEACEFRRTLYREHVLKSEPPSPR